MTPVVIVAVYWVEFASALEGVKVTVVPLYLTVPVTKLFKVKVACETVLASTGSLKVAVIAAFTATPMALLAGMVDETVGAVTPGDFPPPVAAPPPHALNNKATRNTVP